MSDKETPEIEENMLVSWFESKFGFLKGHYNTIAVVAGLLVVGSIIGMVLYQANRDSYAAQWNQLNLSVTNWAFDQKTSHLTDMADQMPNVPASMWALQIAGDAELNLGLEKMCNPLQMSAQSKPGESTDLRATAMLHLKKAKENYQKILDSSVKRSPMLEQRTVFSMARVTESLGEWDSANKYYTQIVEQAPDSEFVDLAKRGVARTSDKNLMAFYDDFRTREMGMAPSIVLPGRPDISFPDVDDIGGGDFEAIGEPSDADKTEDGEKAGVTADAENATKKEDADESKGNAEDGSGSKSADDPEMKKNDEKSDTEKTEGSEEKKADGESQGSGEKKDGSDDSSGDDGQ